VVVKETVDKTICALAQSLDDKWMEATKEAIESADGRKDRNNPICQMASCVYIAYSDDEVLYVGETSKSIKRRFNSDGSGSHREACSWYLRMSHVRYVTFEESELPVMHRKLLEQVLAIHHKPTFYGSRA
jgi:predicted GIY-YIG superfamily endonuclease